MSNKKKFTENLMKWHFHENKRTMPWKGIKDPYKIWLSEIILQQTRVEQGLNYYENFVQTFPTITDLANAKDEVVFKMWEGLGYYTRCKNLLATARIVRDDLKGVFPDKYEDILKLKGIGPYTAAAIATFAYNLPFAVVDGNVFRVLARYFGITSPTDSTDGKKEFNQLAQTVLHQQESALYNQAIMDFGATVCKPLLPLCNSCILNKNCVAFKENIVNKLPVKEKKVMQKNRFFTYFIFTCKNKTLVHQRNEKDIWQNLHEFFLYETEQSIQWNKELVEEYLMNQHAISASKNISISSVFQQQLTHQKIKGQFISVDISSIPISLKKYQWLTKVEYQKLAFPKFINQYLT